MINFIIAFGRNVFGLSAVAVTNAEYVAMRIKAKEQVSEKDFEASIVEPDAPHYNATYERVRSEFAEGGTVAFA